MPFCKLREQEHSKPGIYKPLLFDEATRKQKQHKIGNYLKLCGKEKFDKGPEGIRVTIVDNFIIIRTERYLTKMEKFIIKNDSGGAEQIRAVRENIISGMIHEGEAIPFIENLLDAKAIYCLHDSYPEDEYCIWLIVFDRQLA